MSLLKLERDPAGDIECPECRTKFDANWDTEYGDPLLGQTDVECPECGKTFGVECWTEYRTYQVKP